jgi:precorrin-6Y C5,15-methyltransferase (decarboxylating)
MTKLPVTVFGMGVEGRMSLPDHRQAEILKMDELWGNQRFLNEWPEFTGNKVVFSSHLRAQLEELQSRREGKKIALLASGDPGFFGVSNTLVKLLGHSEVRIYPGLSSLQVAFARVSMPWHDAVLTSVHARPIIELIGLARRHAKIGILTDPRNNPAVVSSQLLAAGIPDCRAIVCENLGLPNEKITDSSLSLISKQSFAPLNVMILVQDPKALSHCKSRSDDAYEHQSGLITKRDVRLIALDRLELTPNSIAWDIGAGSGAVAIEMAELAWQGQVFAIEKSPIQIEFIRRNKSRFGALNLNIIPGEAPQALTGLPLPQAVFIGGSGGKIVEILEFLFQLEGLDCRLAANFTLLENLNQAMQWLCVRKIDAELTACSFSYGQRVGNGTRLNPINPVYTLSAHINQKGAL